MRKRENLIFGSFVHGRVTNVGAELKSTFASRQRRATELVVAAYQIRSQSATSIGVFKHHNAMDQQITTRLLLNYWFAMKTSDLMQGVKIPARACFLDE